jgi:hypothetical protein
MVKDLDIEFIPSSKEASLVVPMPKPAKSYIPEWYKAIPASDRNNKIINDEGGTYNVTLKDCMPFIDSLTTGYIQETWCDISLKFNKEGDVVNFGYSHEPPIITVRDKASVDHGEYFYPIEFTWRMPWQFKLPKGYSALVVSPLNHFLPFHTLSGVIDSDSFFHTSGGNVPFYVHKGFEGIIPVGTPMYQIIPIKRDSWTSSNKDFNFEDNYIRNYALGKFFNGGYKNKFWNKKDYK